MTLNNIFRVSLVILFLFAGLFITKDTFALSSEQQTQLQQIQQQIADTQKLLDDTKQRKSTLQNEIAYQDNQIKLAELKIQETQGEIDQLSGQIDQLEGVLGNLSQVFAERAVETYKLKRTGDDVVLLLSSANVDEFISRFNYLQRIQANDRDLLLQMQTAQTNYEDQRSKVQALNDRLKDQQVTLARQKSAKENLLKVTQSDEKKYQQLLDQAKAQLAAFSRFISSQGGASLLSNQTKCDSWGCYYNQRDSQWGNLSLGGSAYSVAQAGCLISSISMIASHYGKNIKPSDIATVPEAFFADSGNLLDSFSVNGLNVTKTRASKDQLDNLLNQGPVIAGLYSGPDHFIVIVKKDGNDYIMHDPYLENGSNRHLTEKYKVSDITSLRLVQFN